MRITRKLRASWLGSGPRGRRFKSSRPDQFLKKFAKFSQPGHSVFHLGNALGTECSVLQIRPPPRIVRDFFPPLATDPSRPLFEAKRYPRRYPMSWSDTDLRS